MFPNVRCSEANTEYDRGRAFFQNAFEQERSKCLRLCLDIN